METIYDWLLHNVGNEGNSYTILNVQRQTDTEGISLIEVMARTKDFRRVNLFLEPVKKTNSPDSEASELSDKKPDNCYLFTDANQVIAYLTNGETTQSSNESAGIRVSLMPLTDDTTGLTFPPK